MGPLDRIIQTAGRCNREDKRLKEESHVGVFTPLDGSAPLGEYRTGIETALNVIREGGAGFDFDTPTVATEYFASLYKSLGTSGLDKEKVQALRLKHDFPEVARKMRLIKDDTVPVLVSYHQGRFAEAETTEEEFSALVGRNSADRRSPKSRTQQRKDAAARSLAEAPAAHRRCLYNRDRKTACLRTRPGTALSLGRLL